MANIYTLGEKLLSDKDIEVINPDISKTIDNTFDLNEDFSGFVASAGKLPLNAPSDISSYAFYFQLGIAGTSNRVEFAFDINEKVFIRSKSGKTGKTVWDNWKKIGG